MVQDLKAIAQSFVEKDPVFIKNLKNAIEGKKLKRTLVLCSNKALWWQKNKGNMNDLETMRFAFEIFSSVFDKMEMPADLRKKMASTVKKKLISVGKKRMKEKESHTPNNEQEIPIQKRPKKFS